MMRIHTTTRLAEGFTIGNRVKAPRVEAPQLAEGFSFGDALGPARLNEAAAHLPAAAQRNLAFSMDSSGSLTSGRITDGNPSP